MILTSAFQCFILADIDDWERRDLIWSISTDYWSVLSHIHRCSSLTHGSCYVTWIIQPKMVFTAEGPGVPWYLYWYLSSHEQSCSFTLFNNLSFKQFTFLWFTFSRNFCKLPIQCVNSQILYYFEIIYITLKLQVCIQQILIFQLFQIF